jgi:alpha-tubulin suppressor-like RCC1 family protein
VSTPYQHPVAMYVTNCSFEQVLILNHDFLIHRLGLDTPSFMGLTSKAVESVLVPTKLRSIKSRIMDVAMGPNHTVCLTDQGKIIAMGQNCDAQLGRGHTRSFSRPWPEVVKAMADKEVNRKNE